MTTSLSTGILTVFQELDGSSMICVQDREIRPPFLESLRSTIRIASFLAAPAERAITTVNNQERFASRSRWSPHLQTPAMDYPCQESLVEYMAWDEILNPSKNVKLTPNQLRSLKPPQKIRKTAVFLVKTAVFVELVT